MRLTERHGKILDREWDTDGLFARLVRFASAANDDDWFAGLTEYEGRATRLRIWEVALVPGVFQTPDYARSALTAGLVEDIDTALEKRMARQTAVFERPKPPRVFAILNWVALLQPVGDAGIMRGQLAHLLAMSEYPHVSLRILEKDAGVNVGLDGSFQLLTVDDRDVAYAEAPEMGGLVRDPHTVQNFAVRYDRVCEVATPVGPSRTLIQRTMESYQ
ncbi:DUF5753 domain-containing protein [Spirillospora sp. CA-294931]|uniref:DUF5753 domain-containing protein n=1 Tax=Spirillospora sp. CA-294931 TaxID=3240042 RepID=UPI003D89D42E